VEVRIRMRILVVSCSPWRDDNNIGNTYTNIFQGMKNIEIAHICCGSGIPDTKFVKRHFHISEKSIIKNLINGKYPCGYEVNDLNNNELEPIGKKTGFFDFMRKNRLQIFFWVRDLIWSFNNWKSDSLKKFIDDFNPDIIFAIFLDSIYLNKMLLFIHNYIKKPLVLYAWDDVYTLKQFSLSPFYWINKIIQRNYLRKVAKISSAIYTISDFQKKEYSKIFKKECKILFKGYNFNSEYIPYKLNNPLKLVYTGNLGQGRWKSLILIAKALKAINNYEIKAQLFIYTLTPLKNKVKKQLNDEKNVFFKGSATAEEVKIIQHEADILVHAESFDLKNKLIVKYSFSTKLVDYFKSAKCIFAVGSEDVTSIKYLIKYDAAIVAKNKHEIIEKLNNIVSNYNLIYEYGRKSWNCGMKNHDIYKIQDNLFRDLKYISGETYESITN